ncbi:MAG TPA: murein transglycosylase A, partial [Azospirillaceae bacterium]|nr:murein transglycosylase A [Azospirillaceae bacterium]
MVGCARTEDKRSIIKTFVLALAMMVAGCVTNQPMDNRASVAGSRSDPRPEFLHLAGWSEDNHADAIPALLKTCKRLANGDASRGAGSPADWKEACIAARTVPQGDAEAARRYFETWFTPVTLSGTGDQPGLFTGYYEVTLNGSWKRTPRFNVPLYRMPSGKLARRLPERSKIENGALNGKGLELMWVDDPIDAFFLEIQGSGRVRMEDGSVVSLGYAGQNGKSYYPIGKYLIVKGYSTSEEISMGVIRRWLKENPTEARKVMNLNRSYVFFKLRPLEDGPRGAANAPLTPGRSMAVDPKHVPLGTPLWLDVENAPVPGGKIRRVVVAQDVGGAIKGG